MFVFTFNTIVFQATRHLSINNAIYTTYYANHYSHNNFFYKESLCNAVIFHHNIKGVYEESLCMALICFPKLLFWAKVRPQIEQLNGFSPVWLLIWIFKWDGCLILEPHMGHSYLPFTEPIGKPPLRMIFRASCACQNMKINLNKCVHYLEATP